MCSIVRLGRAIVDLCDFSEEINTLFKLLLDKIIRSWNLWKSALHHYILFFLPLKIQIHLYSCMSYLHKCLCITIFIIISLWLFNIYISFNMVLTLNTRIDFTTWQCMDIQHPFPWQTSPSKRMLDKETKIAKICMRDALCCSF